MMSARILALAAAFVAADAFAFAPGTGLMTRAKVSQNLTPSLGLRSKSSVLPARRLRSAAAVSQTKMAAKVKAEYIWIGGRGGVGDDYRSKTKILDKMPSSVDELPIWNYDGSSTGQAPGEDSEVYLKPAFMCKDPTRDGDHLLVLCEMLDPEMNPIKQSTRTLANALFEKKPEEVPWFGIEQEYTLFQDGVPLGWPKSGARPFASPSPLNQFGYPGPQGPYYCAVGYDVSFGRQLVEDHLDLCLEAGLKIAGTNGEVMPGQWEYQVGPCVGIEAGDHLHVSRYLLHRVAEEHGIVVSFDPKPIPGDWNGAGCHTNYSTKKMREEGGLKTIIEACEALGKVHEKHISAYGEGNERRLTGDCETNSIDDFKYGVADRGASIRIPRQTNAEGKGYLEDRRPASNMDPYIVTGLIFDTTCLDASFTEFN